MVQADSLGIPIGRVLRVQSKEMRVKRRQRAEEKAQQVPVKIMIPLVLFILPCLFIVVIGPGGIADRRHCSADRDEPIDSEASLSRAARATGAAVLADHDRGPGVRARAGHRAASSAPAR